MQRIEFPSTVILNLNGYLSEETEKVRSLFLECDSFPKATSPEEEREIKKAKKGNS